VPGGPGVRVDTFAHSECTVSPYYDSMIAKIIVHGRDRQEAIARMRRTLEMTVIDGIKTSIPLHLKILADPDFIAGRLSTSFMERYVVEKKAPHARLPKPPDSSMEASACIDPRPRYACEADLARVFLLLSFRPRSRRNPPPEAPAGSAPPQDPQKPPPRSAKRPRSRRAISSALVHNLGDDVKHLPRLNTVYWLAAAARGRSRSIRPTTTSTALRRHGRPTTFLKPGQYIGNTGVLLGAGRRRI
jgi:hypothetical protein